MVAPVAASSGWICQMFLSLRYVEVAASSIRYSILNSCEEGLQTVTHWRM